MEGKRQTTESLLRGLDYAHMIYKDARRKSVRLPVQSGVTTREVVVRLRDLV